MSKQPEKPTILIVDDDEEIRSQMKWALLDQYRVHEAGSREAAVELVKSQSPAVVCLDLGLPPQPADVEEGFQALDEIVSIDHDVKVVVITGQGEREFALRAIGQGAYDFFSKPIDIDILRVVLSRACHVYELEKEQSRLRASRGTEGFEGMIGASPVIEEVFSMIRKVANSGAPVLLIGESGTGKELAARAIHRRSAQSRGPFVPINCGAIPENLLESELFGHEKGAFTGAHAQRPGQIESARGGTLFLDEIGELPLPLQVKLLRFLQDGQIQRVGGRQLIDVDARIVAATNVDIDAALKEGRFREDLYYRLAVVLVTIPPLRERGEDIPLLASAFLQRYAEENRHKVTGFSVEARRAISEYNWPGNVRELENRVRRAVIMAEQRRVSLQDLGLTSSYARYESMTLREAREAVERELVEAALSRSDGNMSRAAEELGISRPTLYELIEKLGIERT